ncbi:Hypothetical protein D9617_11g010240 [Elsinoe fawcettii]|nr:Hypothetical protein D9617_11g010240 [Elsinoe fawcettii]
MAASSPSATSKAGADTQHDDQPMADAPKIEAINEDTPSSLGSSPEPEQAPAGDSSAAPPDQQQPQKRKGGRKPVSIDVQAELQVKTGSPVFDPSHLPTPMPAPLVPTPLQRSAVNRQQVRRSYQSVNTRPPATQYMPRNPSVSMQSPTGQPTPSSHASSPTAMSNRSTASIQQGGIPSPASAGMAQGQMQQSPITQSQPTARPLHRPMSSQYTSSSVMSSASTEQEYDAPHHQDIPLEHSPHERQQMPEDFDGEDFGLGEQFQDFSAPTVQQAPQPSQQQHGRTRPSTTQPGVYPPGHAAFDSFDPMLDADPFGLTASNDPELDPDREPEPPTKVADKNLSRSGKRTTGGDVVPRSAARGEGAARGNRDNFTGNERAIRDKTAGAVQNRQKPTDDGLRQDRHRDRLREPNEHRDIGGRGRSSRGGSSGYASRGMRGTRTGRDDRHSRTGISDHDKQAGHGWGENTAEGELKDEQGGLTDARGEEEKEGIVVDDTPVDENGVPVSDLPAEPEDKTKSYEQYLAEQLEKKAALNDRPLAARQANEGSSKKFPEGKAFSRDTEEDFIAGSGGKKGRARDRGDKKQVLDIDQTWVETESGRGDRGGRGGRGEGRGGRGRGEGGRGRGEGRGRGGPRGGRGGERGGERGEGRGEGRGSFRGGRGGGPVNISDSSAFPSLGK